MLAAPQATSRAPLPNEFEQPVSLPSSALLPHGQAVPVPSPKQKSVKSPDSMHTDSTVGGGLEMVPELGPEACHIDKFTWLSGMFIDPVWIVNSTAPWIVPFWIVENGTTTVPSKLNGLVELVQVSPGFKLSAP